MIKKLKKHLKKHVFGEGPCLKSHEHFWMHEKRGILLNHIKRISTCKKAKENRIYIRWEFTRKKCKTAILLYCFHTAGILYIFMLYNLLGPGISFYRKSPINIKR